MRRIFVEEGGILLAKYVEDGTEKDYDGVIEGNTPEVGHYRNDPELNDGVVTGERPEIGTFENYQDYQRDYQQERGD